MRKRKSLSKSLAFMLCLGFVANGLVAAAEAETSAHPLLQDGKKSLYQRVLTTPGCQLAPSAGDVKGVLQPAFSSFYVYEHATTNGNSWIKSDLTAMGKQSDGCRNPVLLIGRCSSP